MRYVKELLLGLSLILLVACSQTENEAGADKSDVGVDDLTDVQIMLDWYPNAVHTYLYVAQEKGYFAEEGLDVEIIFPANPTDPINLAATGDVTFGITYQPDIITAQQSGIPVEVVAPVVRSPLNHIIYFDETIETPADLEGKKVGYPGIPVNEVLLETMVTDAGGDSDQVELVDVGFELGSSLITERVDAVIGAYINHEVPVLKHEGYDVQYFNPVDFGVPSFHELVIVTNETMMEEDPSTVEAFNRAIVKGFNDMKENPEESLDILFMHEDQENFPLIREVEEEGLEILLSKMESDEEAFSTQNEDVWEETVKWLSDTGFLEE
ncbi:ABC transporter substrate-binding protein [Salipaludibacillus sp. LMS25]|uniref:ABC transporter substrate-binding protein n=1 Tax=Salipaludibacillus sp. LMS25 TaxID=2924031 RepID=UPI0020D16891|nr:ABC transporter substrate-binding protein [Salipaludibacillus sp. LMS25]UTR16231.1 ABC transporter substrate-binding protein [Salipaludibacillus sp. LMS25]